MIIKNGLVFKEDGTFKNEDVFIKDGIIVDNVKELDDQIIDASNLIVIPGLIDIHSHGAVGHDFCDADENGIKEILKYEKSQGITSYCPTSMTLPEDSLYEIFSTGSSVESFSEGADIVGFNMEGPFIDPKKVGAQNPNYVKTPDSTFFFNCQKKASGLIKLVTLSPNIEGSLEFIEKVKDHVNISIGHTSANYDTTKLALNNGANHVTHLFNAMPPLNHREPGVIGAAINSNCFVEIICDGFHIHPAVIKAAFALFKERVVLISDSMMATGMPDGEYSLGGQKVYVNNSQATLENGSIAGSTTNLFKCFRNAIEFGVSVEDAIFAATANPAKSIGIYSSVGSITVNKKSHILLLDKSFNLVKVII